VIERLYFLVELDLSNVPSNFNLHESSRPHFQNIEEMGDFCILYPGDLETRKSTGTSCQIEIHFMIKTTEYLL
jgi:hypothetical protein